MKYARSAPPGSFTGTAAPTPMASCWSHRIRSVVSKAYTETKVKPALVMGEIRDERDSRQHSSVGRRSSKPEPADGAQSFDIGYRGRVTE